MSVPVLEIANVSKPYGGLRPLRVQALTVVEGEHVAIMGFDQPMAEVFVNLVTGAGLPEHGEVRVFGRSTSAIADSAEWLTLVDRFGIVSERAVMLESLTALQNLALPFTLEIEPPPEEAASRAATLAREAGLSDAECGRPLATLDALARARVRLARAVALDPAVLLLEHPTATVDRQHASALGQHYRAVAAGRGTAIVALTADQAFAEAVAARVMKFDPATGRLTESAGSRWLGRWLG